MSNRRVAMLAAAALGLLWTLVAVLLLSAGGPLVRFVATSGWIAGDQEPGFYVHKLRSTIVALGVLGSFYLSAAVAIVLAGRSTDPARPTFRRHTLVLGALLLYTAAGSVPRYLTGDEPHYLLLAQSVATDGDVDVADEYAARPDLEPHGSESPGDRGTHSVHNVGLGLLLALPWAIGGERGARFVLGLLAALTVGVLDAWLEDRGVGSRDRLVADIAFATCLPLVSFAGQVFPDLPAALLLALAARELTKDGPSARRSWIVAAALATLPWLHVRYLPSAIFLWACSAWAGGRRVGARAGLAVGAAMAASLGVMAIFHLRWFGSPWPNAMRGGIEDELLGRPVEGLLGLFFDQQYGLLVAAPIYALFAAGLVRMAWGRDRAAVVLGGIVAINVALAASFPMWWGGWSTAGRFLVPVLPALAVLSVVAWRECRGSGRLRLVSGGLLAVSMAAALVASVLADQQFGVPGPHGRSFYVSAAERAFQVDLSWVLPRLVGHDGAAPMVGAAAGLALWAALTLALVRAKPGRR